MRGAKAMDWRRWLALWALLAAFAPLALLPAGVMPSQGAGGLTLVLCTGDGPVSVTLDPVTGEPTQDAPDRCAWAVAQGPAVLPLPFAPAVPAPRAADPPPPLTPAVAALPVPLARLPRGPPTPA
jgi:hypothetical protein